MTTPYQQIANRIAEIADQHAQLERATEYDIPDDLENAMTVARDASDDDEDNEDWRADDRAEAARVAFASEYLERALAELKAEAMRLGVVLHPEFIAALLPAVSRVTHWRSSSYGCS